MTKSPTKPLFILLFFVFSAAILGDTASEALLLSHFSASILPNMFLANSLFLFVFSIFLITIVDRLDRGQFYLITFTVHTILIVTIRAFSGFGFTFMYPILFSYSYVTKILTFMIFWTIANDICDARQAKTLFPKIAAGGVLGGMCISFSISPIVKFFEPKDLLLLWAFLSFISIILFLPINKNFRNSLRGRPGSENKKSSFKEDIQTIREEPLLKNMALLYFLMFFLLLNQDFQFYNTLRETFTQIYSDDALGKELSSFLGIFRGISISVTFFIQLTIAGYFIRKLGTAKSMYLMPAAFTFVFGVLFVQTAFGVTPNGLISSSSVSPFYFSLFSLIVVGVGIRIAMFDSIFSPNFQIFFSSLPKEIRGRGKIFIEGLVKPLAISIAGIFMLVVVNKIPNAFRSVIFLLLTLVSIGLLFLTSVLKKRYTDSIARYLGGLKAKRLSSILNIDPTQAGESLLSVLCEAMHGDNEDLRLFSVEMLGRLKTEESLAALREEFVKADNSIKAVIIAELGRANRPEFMKIYKEGLLNGDPRIISNSISSMIKLNSSETEELIKPYIFHKNYRVRANAFIGIWPNANEVTKEKCLNVLRRMAGSENDSDVASAFYAMGAIGDEQFFPFFEESFERLSSRSGKVFIQWATALGSFSNSSALALLMRSLEFARTRDMQTVHHSISRVSGDRTEAFLDYLDNSNWKIKRSVLEIILKTDLRHNTEVISHVRNKGNEMASDAHRLLEMIKRHLVPIKETSMEVLAGVLEEEWIEQAKDCLILVAAILDPTGKIGVIGKKLRHTDSHIRANAIEALENLGDPVLNRLIIPLFEKGKTKISALPPGKVWKELPKDLHTFLQKVLDLSGKWIHDCCIFACYKMIAAKNTDADFKTLLGESEQASIGDIRTKLAGAL